MNKKEIFTHLIYFIAALITLVSVSFAWFNLSYTSEISGIESNIESLRGMLSLEVKRDNETEFRPIKEHNSMIELFDLTKPGDSYTFRITFKNESQQKRVINASLLNVRGHPTNETYDLLNVFILDNIKVINDGIDVSQDHLITPNNFDTVIIHDQQLSHYRLNNLIDENNNLKLFNNISVESSKTAVVTFKVLYDSTTTNTKYQESALMFDSIYVVGS